MTTASSLSVRELQIMSLVVRGKSNEAIAVKLGLAVGTVKNHLASIFHKYGVADRTIAAVVYLTGHMPPYDAEIVGQPAAVKPRRTQVRTVKRAAAPPNDPIARARVTLETAIASGDKSRITFARMWLRKLEEFDNGHEQQSTGAEDRARDAGAEPAMST